MDLPSSAGATPEPFLTASGPEPSIDDLDRRLEAVERNLERLAADVSAVVDSLETTVRAAVATEMHAAAGDLRHTVSGLGRILVRDVGKLPQMLTQHRQEIVAEIRAASAAQPGPPPAPAAEPADEPADADHMSVIDEPDPVADATEPETAPAAAANEEGVAARGWRSRRRQQS